MDNERGDEKRKLGDTNPSAPPHAQKPREGAAQPDAPRSLTQMLAPQVKQIDKTINDLDQAVAELRDAVVIEAAIKKIADPVPAADQRPPQGAPRPSPSTPGSPSQNPTVPERRFDAGARTPMRQLADQLSSQEDIPDQAVPNRSSQSAGTAMANGAAGTTSRENGSTKQQSGETASVGPNAGAGSLPPFMTSAQGRQATLQVPFANAARPSATTDQPPAAAPAAQRPIPSPTSPPLYAKATVSPNREDRAAAPPRATAREMPVVDPPVRDKPDEAILRVKPEGRTEGMVTIDGDRGPIKARKHPADGSAGPKTAKGQEGLPGGVFHKRLGPIDFNESLRAGLGAVRGNLSVVMVFTVASNILVLAIPIYLFQIADRILTSRSIDTLVMLTILITTAVILQAIFDAIRRFILMRTAVEFAAQLGAPVLSAASRASLQGSSKDYQTLGDIQQVRSFLVSRTLLSFMDAPMAPLFVLAVFLIHPQLGSIVVLTSLTLLVLALMNQKATAAPFAEANTAQVRANLHLESMSRNSQIINAMAMIPEAVQIWGKDTAESLKSQVIAQDRNIVFAAMSKGARLLTQVAMLGWGAYLALQGELTGGMVITASIIAGRALAPIEGAIEGWNQYSQTRSAFARISSLLKASPLNVERLNLPRPKGRLDVERLLYVPQGTKRVVLNGVTFALAPGESLGIIGNSGAGKTTLGKMLVGSILPTSGNVRLDLMDLRNWDQRQFGENIGYLPQDVQLFPGTIKANIARMRADATDAQVYEAAALADVHEMIANLPHGYETVVAGDGAPLSGGQKQRIALARAFFGNPRLVVLDEPNSNLDSSGDAALTRALRHAKQNDITIITITQRPSLLSYVDKIMLLVNGTVALVGARNDVLNALSTRGISLDAGTGSFGHQPIEQPGA